jgi:purine-binding chemotaxis protein CheW
MRRVLSVASSTCVGRCCRLSTSRRGFPPTEPTTRHAILVVQIGNHMIGLLVEGVSEILTISQDLIQPTPDVASQMAKDFVSGIVATDGRMISLIALDAIMPATEQAAA